jgi:hypothetical protein
LKKHSLLQVDHLRLELEIVHVIYDTVF